MRTLLLPAVLILTTAMVAPWCSAQEDPYDIPIDPEIAELIERVRRSTGDPLYDRLDPPRDDDEADAGSVDRAEEVEEEEKPPSALVTQLLEHAARGNGQFADAVASLARLGRWSEVNRLFSTVEGRGLSVEDRVEMTRRIGAATLLEIELNEKLSEPARAAASKFREASAAHAQDRGRLRSAVDGLDDVSVDKRLAAVRVLLAGGNAAIAELVAAAVSENPPAPRDDILRTMLRLGEGGPKALRQLALYGQPSIRLRATESLARVDRNAAIPELVTALYAADSTPQEVQFATDALQRRGSGLPSRTQAVVLLASELEQLRENAARVDRDDRLAIIWSIDDGRTQVTYQPVVAILATYRDAVDAASRLRRIGNLPLQVERSAMSADIAYRLMIDPDWGDPDQITAFRQSFGESASGSSLMAAISEALSREDDPTLVGLLRLVDPETPDPERRVYLQSTGPEPTPLVSAASASDARVRYEAAITAAKLGESLPYAGSSQVRRCLSEMQTLRELPTAILVETRPEVIVRQETLLGRLGLDVEVCGSVADVQRRVARGGDIRLILSKTNLADLTAIEMVDMVRRIERGRRIPMVFYGSDVIGLDSGRWEAVTAKIDMPASPAAFSDILRRIEIRRRLPPMTVLDRQLYAEAAAEQL